MRADLLLPATPEMLDGWAPYVVIKQFSETLEGYLLPESEPDGWRFVMAPADGKWTKRLVRDEARIFVPLDRAEARDRVVRVVPQPWRNEPGPGALSLRRSGDYVSLCIGGYVVADSRSVPALADLDPHDDTRLPDGSRLVDALALRAVAMEVLHGR